MRQYFTPKLLFAGLFMLAMSGMASCNSGSSEGSKLQTEQPANVGAVTASNNNHDEDHDNDSDDAAKELEKTKHQLSELSSKVETLESQLSEYEQGHDKANEELKDEFGIIKVMAIIAIIFSVISIAISVLFGRKTSTHDNIIDSRSKDDHSRQLNELRTSILNLQKEANENKTLLLLLKKEVTALEAEKGQRQATAQPTYANQRKPNTPQKIPTKTVYFEETMNGRFENPSDTIDEGYSNYICKITGDTAIFEPIKNLERLKSADHLKEAVRFEGDKDRARDAEIKPGKAVKEGSRWRITEKAVVRFK